jgi:hypothetical protein
MPNIEMDIEDEIFNKQTDQAPKKKRVLSDKQKEALAKGRARAKEIRDQKSSELKKETKNTKEEKKKSKDQEEDVKVSQGLKQTQRAISKKKRERQEAVAKKVHRNSNQREFEDMAFKIAETLDNEKDLKHFQNFCSQMKHEDFKDKASMRSALANVIYGSLDQHFALQKKK